jgi:hypothetical protein
MKICNKCNTNSVPNTRCRICSDCKHGRRGLRASELLKIATHQGMQCPLSGNRFEVNDKGQVIDTATKKQAHIDHDHASGLIRGLLSEKLNWLVDEFEKGSYGFLSEPQELKNYRSSPPAFIAIGEKPWQD